MLVAYAVVLAVLGAALAYEGGRLVAVGGSWYYVLAGIAVLVAGVLLALGKRAGLWLFGATLAATIVWALWEVGLDGWGLIPRLAWISVLGLVLLPFWGVARRRMQPLSGLGYAVVTGVLPVLGAALILWPLLVPRNVELADASKQPADAATPFSRGSVPSPDGNVAANHDASNWTAYAGSNLSNHYTPGAQITPENVKGLKVAWEFHTGDLKPKDSKLGYAFQNTPLKVGDLLYICTPTQKVIAVEAANGKERWRFDPQTNPKAMAGVAATTCRGVSYYQAPEGTAECPTRIFWPMVDGRLGALDAQTGKLCASFGNNGYVDLNAGTGNTKPGFVGPTSPPVVMRGVVIQPTGQVRDGQERDAPSGVVRGFDALTGQLRWAWDLGNPAITAEPPAGQTYTRSTPNVWSLMAADDELGLVYLPTGNAAGDFFGKGRTPQEEEYTASLVAVDAATGKERWHFRTVNHDLWDYDIGPQPNLVDWPVAGGGTRPAVIQATKSGQVFVLDRATGQPIMPVKQIAVPQGTDHGDWTASTQPVSPGMPNTVGAPSRDYETIVESDAWGMTPFDQLACRIEFKKLRYEGMFTPPSLQGSLSFTGNHGGINWGGVSVDLQRGIMVMNSNRLPYTEHVYPRTVMNELGVVSVFNGSSKTKGYMAQEGLAYGARKEPWMSPLNTPCVAPPWGYISGVDLRTQQVIWRRPLGTGYDQGPMGIPSKTKFEIGTPNNSGSLATAGGVTFIGASLDNFIRGFDTRTGKQVWETRVPAGPQAAPLSYTIDGKQYIVAAVGGHDRMETKSGDSVIAWALPDDAAASAK
ncbi:glucose/quinate/shikimate family membrane-bound PQQ-dependent dehydrogenase [Xanthomonas campestris pv. campestris]|uniref:glucose/quinate/shikimate family membrane-bound PQQ-dependent dehydrogenase n=1 Tax=Xanthomonas campestris TaxID=339 RepID=UPI00049277FC|nr:glucose/quinate/shikimate family membrane-bound PQQ-dependent dehydrogenase [Xanthomonas campestris]MCD0251175.1 glucose/quinate/shikimate family membrane-bound PQQ-dependent dehydrogenase [Xanthomonas campestris pv. campestris]MCD0255245.1 glucose/quinate/shikimate family membrane-bound PQQ-dependent dehydrogenase [Xanthomonas campestris pv. campestris]MCD0263925.1 glucose/quinate/shikimate family membrane-bound PQQ-dependent dehydrogenase [Xanthomonas campestris pv. campestris]MCD0272169.1